MPQTSQFEAYESYILKPLSTLRAETEDTVLNLIRELINFTDNIRGEARNNYIEGQSDYRSVKRLFSDILDKVNGLEDVLFESSVGVIQYKPAKPDIQYINETGTLEEMYAFHIHNSLQRVRLCLIVYMQVTSNEFQLQQAYFTLLNPDRQILNDAFSQLKRFGYIAVKTDKKDFVNIFTTRAPRHPIIWIGGYNSLAYLIRGLIKSKVFPPMRRGAHWPIVMNAFTTPDGPIEDKDKLRSSDPPDDTANLNTVIDTFCSTIS
jgi:hypothetical protein